MKVNNKKQTKKLLPWLASISFFAVGAMAIMPMATACSNGGDTPPEPAYADDPTDFSATEMVGGTDFIKKQGAYLCEIPATPKSKKIIFKAQNYAQEQTTPMNAFVNKTNPLIEPFQDMEYIEIGENFGSLPTIPRSSIFNIGSSPFQNVGIKKLVLRYMGGTAKNELIGYQTYLDGSLDGISEIFFDFNFDEISVNPFEGATKFFTKDPDVIYIREGKGTVEQWKNKLVGLSTDKIIKVVAKNSI